MKWLLNRILNRKEPRSEGSDEAQVGEGPPDTLDPAQPGLILLVHDASAPACYRLHTFEDAPAAEGFVQTWFPRTIEHGILAFWALHDEPLDRPNQSSDERPAEVVILVRDEERRDLVYPFSLPNMKLAHLWLVKEMARGLQLSSVLMYWAAQVKIARNRFDNVRITPSAPPPVRRPTLVRSSTVIVRKDEPVASPEERVDDVDAESTERAEDSTRALDVADRLLHDALGEEDDAPPENRRWEQRDRPFRGFDSPRGRF